MVQRCIKQNRRQNLRRLSFLSADGKQRGDSSRLLIEGKSPGTESSGRPSRSFHPGKLRPSILLFVTGCRRYRWPATSLAKPSMPARLFRRPSFGRSRQLASKGRPAIPRNAFENLTLGPSRVSRTRSRVHRSVANDPILLRSLGRGRWRRIAGPNS